MRAGSLRDSITILQNQPTPDATYGGEEESWVTYASVRARFKFLSGREYAAADRVNGEISAQVTLRHAAGVTRDMRVRCDAVDYEIVHMTHDTKKRWLDLYLKVVQ